MSSKSVISKEAILNAGIYISMRSTASKSNGVAKKIIFLALQYPASSFIHSLGVSMLLINS